jgi:arabinose-5-phosphate isomerase
MEMSAKRLGFTTVVDDENNLLGMFTDGDLRRSFANQIDLHTTKIGTIMTRDGVSIQQGALAAEALKLMEESKVNGLPVVNAKQQVVGAFNMHDLFKAGVV